MKFRIVIEQDEEGAFIASCPTLPGCWSQGDTREQAKANIEEAVTAYLESLKKHGDPIPPPINEDTVEIDDELGRVA
jgi:predicted RNase H-like HicB family nuclease